jgi:hypothetical protein
VPGGLAYGPSAPCCRHSPARPVYEKGNADRQSHSAGASMRAGGYASSSTHSTTSSTNCPYSQSTIGAADCHPRPAFPSHIWNDVRHVPGWALACKLQSTIESTSNPACCGTRSPSRDGNCLVSSSGGDVTRRAPQVRLSRRCIHVLMVATRHF